MNEELGIWLSWLVLNDGEFNERQVFHVLQRAKTIVKKLGKIKDE